MPVRIVQSKHNPRLKDLRRILTRTRRDENLAAVEGPNLVREAVRAGVRILSVFAAQEDEHLLADLGLNPETEILLTPRALLVDALATEAPQPVAALIEPPQWTWPDLFTRPNPLIVVLAGLQDPGNLGTILRSAEAFGAAGIVSLPGTVHEWNPKSVRASAGSVLRIPVVSAEPALAFQKLKDAGITTLATAIRDAQPAPALGLTGSVAFIIGNEGNGLAPEIAALADASVTIPCPGPVESLNAAVATSILLYETARQRSRIGGMQ
jgi:RNA methyltransferase, TrmH family